MEDTSALHRVQDDMESVFWVLLWTVLVFSPSSLSLQARTTFIRSTFESIPGTESKRGMFASQTIHEPTLLPGRESLHKLLKAFADLFRYFYYRPEKRDEDAVKRVKALQDHSIDVEDVLQALPSYQHDESVKKLKNHEYIIDLFSRHLQMEWPADDAAEEQELIGTDCFGEDLGKVVVLKSKHVLEAVIEEEQSRSHKRRKVQTVNRALGPDLEPVDQDDPLSDASAHDAYHEETESESSHLIPDGFWSSLTSLSSSP